MASLYCSFLVENMLAFLWDLHLVWWVIMVFVTNCLVIRIYSRITMGKCKSNRTLIGKTAIVTGANSGIGKETARDLAVRGAHVILACRSMSRALAAAKEIIATTGNNDVIVKHLDLSSLKSVHTFVDDFLQTESRLDILVNNAGIAGSPERHITADGFELVFETNYLGPFLLTNLLLDRLKQSAPSRIVNVSSFAHRWGKIEFNNLNGETWFRSRRIYANSKLANILFTRELSRRLEGTGVTVNALHPGMVRTEILEGASGWFPLLVRTLFMLFGKNAVEGAQTTIHLAVSEQVEGVSGKYFSDCRESKPYPHAEDMAVAKKLWELSEQLVGLS